MYGDHPGRGAGKRSSQGCLLGALASWLKRKNLAGSTSDSERDTLSAMEKSMVRGLVLPVQLTSLLCQGRWCHPGDAEMARLIPWFEDPLDFLANTEQMTRESRSMDRFADDEGSSALFREIRGSSQQAAVELPWLDVEQAVLVAVNRHAGDDVALALDYRSNPADPCVVGSDFWTNPRQCEWRPVTPTFSAFVHALSL